MSRFARLALSLGLCFTPGLVQAQGALAHVFRGPIVQTLDMAFQAHAEFPAVLGTVNLSALLLDSRVLCDE